MNETQIVLLILLGILTVGIAVIFAVANLKKAPDGTIDKANPFAKAYRFVFGTRKASHFSSPLEAMYYSPNRWLIDLFFAFLIGGIVLYMSTDLNILGNLRSNSAWNALGQRLSNMLTPDWNYFLGIGKYRFNEGVFYQLMQTFSIGFVSTFIASVLAIPFGLLASHKLCGKYAFISEVFLILIRTFPEVLLAIVMVGLTGMNPMTGVLALGLHSIGMVGKLYSEQIDEIDFVPLEAIESAGGSLPQRITEGIMPQFRPGMYSVAIYRFDINLRTSAILGMVVGADCGIGFALSNHSKGNLDSLLGADILGIVILIVLVDIVSSQLRKKLV